MLLLQKYAVVTFVDGGATQTIPQPQQQAEIAYHHFHRVTRGDIADSSHILPTQSTSGERKESLTTSKPKQTHDLYNFTEDLIGIGDWTYTSSSFYRPETDHDSIVFHPKFGGHRRMIRGVMVEEGDSFERKRQRGAMLERFVAEIGAEGWGFRRELLG